ncbi:hypothetical protein HA151_06475 [Prochlorococcus marinus XMU1419]|uniref:hypothetical protein n=1 Tax=Prochlorococcus marinus TaxID=1219 RepID=UPI001ADA60D5|nr:hypothetical protein [Prochlorococcus marinus]MBO8234159.1 hypothetical protein [Prochlorococcus marinus XMU1419]MBW3075848.1 hypothetical protein [Prochlorococcus marinus str. XMU1419]
MNFELNFDSKELAKLGILETFFKRKLKHYLTKKVQKSLNTEQQLKIINDWKKKNSIKSNSELEEWLHLYELNMDEWINLINSDYQWSYWCMNKYKDELSQYFIKRKDYLDLYYYTIIKVKNKDLADEIYIRIKEEESTFEEIVNNFSNDNEIFYAEKIGPISLNNIEDPIASLIKIGDLNQLFQPKSLNEFWFILRKDNVLKAEFNNQQKIKLSLELGEKFLHNRFIENQKQRNI